MDNGKAFDSWCKKLVKQTEIKTAVYKLIEQRDEYAAQLAEARALLVASLAVLNQYHTHTEYLGDGFSEDYNNDDVIKMCDKLNEFLGKL